jgi:hypothetical protein
VIVNSAVGKWWKGSSFYGAAVKFRCHEMNVRLRQAEGVMPYNEELL